MIRVPIAHRLVECYNATRSKVYIKVVPIAHRLVECYNESKGYSY